MDAIPLPSRARNLGIRPREGWARRAEFRGRPEAPEEVRAVLVDFEPDPLEPADFVAADFVAADFVPPPLRALEPPRPEPLPEVRLPEEREPDPRTADPLRGGAEAREGIPAC